jgi:hypothetical protein
MPEPDFKRAKVEDSENGGFGEGSVEDQVREAITSALEAEKGMDYAGAAGSYGMCEMIVASADDEPICPYAKARALSIIHAGLGYCIHKLQPDSAKTDRLVAHHYRQSVRHWPENALALNRLACVEWKRGHTMHALSVWRSGMDTEHSKGAIDTSALKSEWATEMETTFRSLAEERDLYPGMQYRVCIALHQLGCQNELWCLQLLQYFGFKISLARQLWMHQRRPPVLAPAKKTKKCSKISPQPQPADPVARLFTDVLPRVLHEALCDAFAPSSVFWDETGYNDPASNYTSFWYPLDREPTNVVEQLVQLLRPLNTHSQNGATTQAGEAGAAGAAGAAPVEGGQGKIVGAEWWVHTRVHGEEGHQLHYDMDERHMQDLLYMGDQRCPVKSSVVVRAVDR